MNKREFLKTSGILGAGTLIAPTITSSCMTSNAEEGVTASLVSTGPEGKFVQPELGYAFDALEPHVDAMTMELHYTKHHAGYTSKLNAGLEHEDMHSTDLVSMFANISNYGISTRNNGGGYYNHNLFWRFMSPDGGGEPSGDLAGAIDENFGSFQQFRDLFTATAGSHFGSGWAWLILDGEGALQVTSTPNQDNPLMNVARVQGTPILNIDVWEHAYYLKYQNQRAKYIEAYWNLIDWDFAGSLYNEAVG